jgi:hypothetical protein
MSKIIKIPFSGVILDHVAEKSVLGTHLGDFGLGSG